MECRGECSGRVKRCAVGVSLVVGLSLLSFGARAQTWPGESDWIPVTSDGVPVGDPCTDVSGAQRERDLVGPQDKLVGLVVGPEKDDVVA